MQCPMRKHIRRNIHDIFYQQPADRLTAESGQYVNAPHACCRSIFHVGVDIPSAHPDNFAIRFSDKKSFARLIEPVGVIAPVIDKVLHHMKSLGQACLQKFPQGCDRQAIPNFFYYNRHRSFLLQAPTYMLYFAKKKVEYG